MGVIIGEESDVVPRPLPPGGSSSDLHNPRPTTTTTTTTPGTGGDGGGDDTYDDIVGDPDTPEGLLEFTLERYPQLAPFLNIPEIAIIIELGAEEGWGPDRFKGEFMKTDWYRENSSSYREAWALQQTDPATWEREVAGRHVETRNLIGQAGFRVSDDVAWDAAENSLLFGWSEPELLDYIATQVNPNDGFQPGYLTELSESIQQTARSMHVRYDEGLANTLALDVWAGRLDEDAALSMFRDRARERYTWMGDWLDQGGSVEAYFAPIKQEAAAQLEINPDDINLMDSEWMGLAETVDPETGQRRGLSLTEAVLWARQRPEFENTTTYGNETQSVTAALGELFGRSSI